MASSATSVRVPALARRAIFSGFAVLFIGQFDRYADRDRQARSSQLPCSRPWRCSTKAFAGGVETDRNCRTRCHGPGDRVPRHFPAGYSFLLARIRGRHPSNPSLYAALLGAVHFLLFVMLVRLYSATTDRDAFFLAILAFSAILAAAILTVDTSFLVLFFVFLLFGGGHICGHGDAARRKGAVVPPFAAARAGTSMARALILAALSVALGAILMGGALFFLFPAIQRRLSRPHQHAAFVDDRIHRRCRAWADRRNQEKPHGGDAGENRQAVCLTRNCDGAASRCPTFDGKRWSTPNHRPAAIAPDAAGWIYVADPEQNLRAPAIELHYEILVQPMATDAVFAPANAVSILGGFSGENPTASFNARRTYLFPGLHRIPFQSVPELRSGALLRILAASGNKCARSCARLRRTIRTKFGTSICSCRRLDRAHR